MGKQLSSAPAVAEERKKALQRLLREDAAGGFEKSKESLPIESFVKAVLQV